MTPTSSDTSALVLKHRTGSFQATHSFWKQRVIRVQTIARALARFPIPVKSSS